MLSFDSCSDTNGNRKEEKTSCSFNLFAQDGEYSESKNAKSNNEISFSLGPNRLFNSDLSRNEPNEKVVDFPFSSSPSSKSVSNHPSILPNSASVVSSLLSERPPRHPGHPANIQPNNGRKTLLDPPPHADDGAVTRASFQNFLQNTSKEENGEATSPLQITADHVSGPSSSQDLACLPKLNLTTPNTEDNDAKKHLVASFKLRNSETQEEISQNHPACQTKPESRQDDSDVSMADDYSESAESWNKKIEEMLISTSNSEKSLKDLHSSIEEANEEAEILLLRVSAHTAEICFMTGPHMQDMIERRIAELENLVNEKEQEGIKLDSSAMSELHE
uniref:Uncharacterized protein n=1 Tax=Hanusia phi TaxID=3032 RepID=A0A7S0HMA9_9CRYP|mmetsp:Transcript_32028/g.71962  ORF Transcript_32028/g.71962 Transcript_32028/m.71962 type:complete len:334 (+) Transcript_32028:181-1182(+)